MLNTLPITDSSLLNEKQECEQLLNTAMTMLHKKFGTNNDPKTQHEIHKKLNGLKLLVSIIEKQATEKHIAIDKKMDEAQRMIQRHKNKKHQQTEDQKKNNLIRVYGKFNEWIDTNNLDDNHNKKNNNNNNSNVHNHNNKHHQIQRIQPQSNNAMNNMNNMNNTINPNQIIQQNQNGNLIIITDGRHHVMNAFIIQQKH